MGSKKTRLQRKREKESLREAVKYLLLIFGLLILMVRFGLPALIKMAGFIGSIRSSKEPIEQEESLPIAAPRLYPLVEATNSASIDVEGVSDSGNTIQLFLQGISIKETTAADEGKFKFKDIHLRNGENEIYTVARDAEGGESNESSSWIVILDQEAPKLEILKPETGQSFFDTDNPIMVKGRCEPGASLLVNGRLVFVDESEEFETSVRLDEGDNQIDVVARDEAGNETRQQIVVNYTP